MSFFKIDNFNMFYEIAPQKLNHDTLLIHGNLANSGWWKPALECLSSKDEGLTGSIYMADWRGCGQSSATENQDELLIPNMANDYIKLIEELGLKQVDLVGHSTGGLIALQMMILRPELFRKAILLDTVGPEGVKLEPEMLGAFEVMRTQRDICETVMATTINNVDTKSDFFQKVIVDGAFKVAAPNWAGIPTAITKIHLQKDLNKITQPVTVLHGELDPVLPIDVSRKLAQDLPNGTFVELKGHGHSMNVEDPNKMAECLIKYLA